MLSLNKQINYSSLRKNIFIGIILFIIFFLLYSYLQSFIPFPGHGDPCYYVELAQNLHNGNGFTISYVSYFYNLFPTIVHPAGDYWMPLAAILFALFFTIAPPTFASIQILGAILGALMVVIVFLIARYYLRLSSIWAITAAVFFAFDVDWVFNVVIPQTGIFFTFILLIFFMLFSSSNETLGISLTKKRTFFIGLVMGLAHLCRPDGILLLAVFFVVILFTTIEKKQTIREVFLLLLVAGAGYAVITGGWFIRNIMIFHKPLPVPSFHFIFFTNYEQIYTYNFEGNFEKFINWGFNNILFSKLHEAWRNVNTFFHFRWSVILLFGGYFTLKKYNPFKVAFIYLIILWSVLSFILTMPENHGSHGTFGHALPALIPFIYISFIVGFKDIISFFSKSQFSKKITSTIFILSRVFLGLLLCFSMFAVFELYGFNQAIVVKDIQGLWNNLQKIGKLLPENAILMTRNPWEVHYVTKRKTVQIPYDNKKIFDIMQIKYKVTYLLLTDETRNYLKRYLLTEKGKKEWKKVFELPFQGHIFHYDKFVLYHFHPF